MSPSRFAFLPALLAVLVAGCGGSPVAPPGGSTTGSTDQAEVSSALSQTPQVIDEDEFGSSDPYAMDGGTPGSLAAIQPLRWWRRIADVERTFEFAFADTDSTGHPTTAVVTVRKRLAGTFNILAGESLDSASVVHKPLVDRWVRHVLLKRVRVPERDRPAWRVVATSGVEVTARDADTRIQSLRVQSAGVDTTITDPLRFFFLRRILRFEAETEVTLTVTTLRADDVVVLQLRDHRLRFHNNGDGTYTGTWRTGALAGLRHFGVDALAHDTLFDDEEPYDSQAWLLPYVVAPTEMAERLP